MTNIMILLQICSKHEKQGISVPIQPVSTSEDVHLYEEEIRGGEARREAYLLKRVQPELTDPSKIVTQLDLWFPCWNKCGERLTDFTAICHLFTCLTAGTSTYPEVLTSSRKFTKEAARDIYLSGK